MPRFRVVLLVIVGLFALDVRAQAPHFVTVRDGRFFVDGAPFRFLGANASVMHGGRERAAYETTLDAIVADGGRVVRIWALGEAPADAPAWRSDYAFRFGPEGFVATSYEHLDAVLVAARARGLRVIVVLANRWRDYGGFPEYLRWAEPDVPIEASGNVPLAMLGRIYGSPNVRALYRAHVARIVGRTNTRTGVAYRDDDTIFAWELANETTAQSDEDQTALLAWTRSEATFIKSLDPNHLIAAGHIGYDTERERAGWLAVNALEVIDYADVHLYPLGDPRVRTRRDLVRYVRDRVALAHDVLAKPLLVGEFGFDGDARTRAHRPRTAWTRDFVSMLEPLGVAGALVWFYEPVTTSERAHTIPATVAGLAAPMRTLLRSLAPRFARARMPTRIGRGNAPSFVARATERGRVVHRFAGTAGRFTIEADALDFEEAAFERQGTYRGGPVSHVWGTGDGHLSYRFQAPDAAAPSRLVLRLFVSSELDGRGLGARPSETSLVRVRLDDTWVAVFEAPVDDGVGRSVEVVIDDPAVLARVFARRGALHRLALVASATPGAGGLCVYGAVVETPLAGAQGGPSAAERLPSLRLVWESIPR